jgi:glycosyltransferase involved in cell wall biosynthesis
MAEDVKQTASPLSGHHLVVFGPDWGRHPSVSQHVFQQFVGKSRIIWVETVGMRTPKLTWRDVKRSWQKLSDFWRAGRRRQQPSRAVVAGVHVVTPVTLPFTRFSLVRLFNLWQVRRAVRRAVDRFGFVDYTLVATVPSQCDFVGKLGEARSLYYCIDDYALWPGMESHHVRRMERRLASAVDAIVVSSDALATAMRDSGKPVHLLSHGVDAEHFGVAPVHRLGQAFEIVYFGLIDERMDQDLVLAVAAALPRASIRLIGPVVTDVNRLTQVANIRLEGAVPYQNLPEVVATADLFILPYVLSELAKSINPIKLKEYLACGRPVVATALPEVQKLAGLVAVARDQAHFVEMTRAAAAQRLPVDRQAVQAFVAAESWHAKAVAFGSYIEALGTRSPSAAPHGIASSQNGGPDVSLATQPSM